MDRPRRTRAAIFCWTAIAARAAALKGNPRGQRSIQRELCPGRRLFWRRTIRILPPAPCGSQADYTIAASTLSLDYGSRLYASTATTPVLIAAARRHPTRPPSTRPTIFMLSAS